MTAVVQAGIIPAHAGSTKLGGSLPPHARIIPAHAGSTVTDEAGKENLGDHPRSRGEHFVGLRLLPRHRGSSPLTRGAPRSAPQTADPSRPSSPAKASRWSTTPGTGKARPSKARFTVSRTHAASWGRPAKVAASLHDACSSGVKATAIDRVRPPRPERGPALALTGPTLTADPLSRSKAKRKNPPKGGPGHHPRWPKKRRNAPTNGRCRRFSPERGKVFPYGKVYLADHRRVSGEGSRREGTKALTGPEQRDGGWGGGNRSSTANNAGEVPADP